MKIEEWRETERERDEGGIKEREEEREEKRVKERKERNG